MRRKSNGSFTFGRDECVLAFNATGSGGCQFYSDRLAAIASGDNSRPMTENMQMGLFFARFFRDPGFRSIALKAIADDMDMAEASDARKN